MKKIIFICTGNTCRSPMAQMIMNQLLNEAKLEDIEVHSRGLHVFSPSPVCQHVHTLMKERSIDSSFHYSQPLCASDYNEDTLILTMTTGHREWICAYFPQFAPRTFTLAQYSIQKDQDIVDPYGGSLNIYRTCANELEYLLQHLFQKLKKSEFNSL